MAKLKRIPDEITMMDLRQQPGEVLRAVEYDGRSIMVTKAGKTIAKIVPVEDVTVIRADGSWDGPRPITFRQQLGDKY